MKIEIQESSDLTACLEAVEQYLDSTNQKKLVSEPYGKSAGWYVSFVKK